MNHSRTLAVRTAQYHDLSDAHCEPIAMTSAYVFRSCADAADRFSGVSGGNVYSRFTNPTVRAFEKRLAAMEGAEDAVAFASGMAAIAAAAHTWLHAGANVVCARDVFGTTLHALRHYLSRFGVDVRVVPIADLGAWREAIDAQTRLVFLETPSNPLQKVVDIAHLAALAHRQGALLLVDNTLLTPLGQHPLALGADLVVHSASKYIDGQGRCMGGIVAGSGSLMAELRGVTRSLGSALNPMDAWLLLKSLETLELRMAVIETSARTLARWLCGRAEVGPVHYGGLPDHPQRALIERQQEGTGGLIAFEVGSSRAHAWSFIDSLSLVSIAANIGDARSMVTHPATTTHGRLSVHDLTAVGIRENLVRLSVGLENVEDIIEDLACALERGQPDAPSAAGAPPPVAAGSAP